MAAIPFQSSSDPSRSRIRQNSDRPGILTNSANAAAIGTDRFTNRTRHGASVATGIAVGEAKLLLLPL